MPILPIPTSPPTPQSLSDRLYIQTASFGEPPPPQDAAYYRRVLDRVLPVEYVRGLQEGGGEEVLAGLAAVAARTALANQRWDNATLAGYASVGSRATGWVYFYRDTADAGAVVVKQGTVVMTDDQRRFYTKADVAFDAGELGPKAAPIEATLPGYEYNVGGEELTALGEIIPGQITQIALLLESPDFADPSMRVRNVAPTEGGADPQLEQLAEDRGVSARGPSEGEDEFRLRVKTITDGVTPAGIERSGNNIIRKWAPRFQLSVIDSWDFQYQTGYDCRIPGAPNFPPTIFVYDDPRAPQPRNRWLSHEGANGGEFVAALSYLPCLADQAMWLSDPADTPGELLTPGTDGGRRANSYLSLPYDIPDAVVPCGIGARDGAVDGVYGSLYQMLLDQKAAGTNVYMLLLGQP